MKIMKLLKQILSITLIAVSMIVFISGCFLNSVVDRVINNIEALDAFECYSSENHEVFISKYNKPFGGISKFGRISKNNEDAFFNLLFEKPSSVYFKYSGDTDDEMLHFECLGVDENTIILRYLSESTDMHQDFFGDDQESNILTLTRRQLSAEEIQVVQRYIREYGIELK